MILVYAYLLDLVLGDPERFPHPVRLMGKWITFLEKVTRKNFKGPRAEIFGGVFLWFSVVFPSYIVTHLILAGSKALNEWFGYGISVFFAYTIIAIKDLHKETKRVMEGLGERLEVSRERLSRIVGRDTESLSEQQVLNALVETISENTSDGIIAPMFYLIIGGVPLAMAYKAVNTLDSMLGYKEEKYLRIGWFSARMDDGANFIPARITGLLIVLASFFLGLDWRNAFRILLRDGRNHPSPNAGIPEAATAGALGIKLGGTSYYFGKPYIKPTIGDGIKEIDRKSVKKALRIMHVSVLLMVLPGSLIIEIW